MSQSESLGGRKEVHLTQGVISYRECGAGAPIVFVHGLLVNGDLWRKVVPKLALHYRCITPDLPLGAHAVAMRPEADLSPHGLAQLIADFLLAIDVDDVTLVANDTGGALTQILVTEQPQRIARLVLTNCDAYENFLPKMFRYLQWGARIPGATFLLTQPMRLRALHSLPLTFGWLAKRRIDPVVTESYFRPVLTDRAVRRDLGKVLRGISSRYTVAAARKLNGFQRPVLLAWAREDRFFPLSDAARLRSAFPDARLTEVADSYTFISEDQPHQLAELIAGFLRESGTGETLRAVK